MWMYILTILSAVMLFGFMGIGIKKYGLLSCYSAYGPLWDKWYPKLNIWSTITFLTAAILMPVMLQISSLSVWQFLGFLAPVSLFAVSASPNYQTDKFANIMHQIGAWGAVAAVTAFLFLIPHLWWIVIPFLVGAIILGIIFEGTLMLWAEIAMYSSNYAAIFMMIPEVIKHLEILS